MVYADTLSTIWWKAKTANRPPVGFCLPILICQIKGHRALTAMFLAEAPKSDQHYRQHQQQKQHRKSGLAILRQKGDTLSQSTKSIIVTFLFSSHFFCINRSFTRQAVIDNLPRCLAELFVMCASKISKMVIWKLTWKESTFKIRIKPISVRFARSHFIMRGISIPIQECMMKEGNTVKYVRSLLNGRFRRVTWWSIVTQAEQDFNAKCVQNLSPWKMTWHVMLA